MKRFFLLLLIAAGLIAFYHSRTGELGLRPGPAELRLPGRVELREVTLGFRIPGRLAGLNCEEGERVEAGQILAWLDQRSLEGPGEQDETSLLAPGAGTILTREREPGAVLPEGAVIYTLALDNPVWVRAYIDQSGLDRVRSGQKARVRTESGSIYQGHVGAISPQAEAWGGDSVYRLRVIVDQPDRSLSRGQAVTVELPPPGP